MANRVTDDCEPEDIPFHGWEDCERRGDCAKPGRHFETDETHEEGEDETI